MKKGRILAIVAVVVIIVLIGYCLLAHNSLSLAVEHAGYQADSLSYIVELEKDSLGFAFSVFQTYSDSGEIALIYAKRDAFGFWHLENINDYRSEHGYASIVWSEGATVRRFAVEQNPVFEWEWHYAYCSDNAINSIVINPEQLPENCTVNVQQAGSFYLIHIIRFATDTESFDIGQILLENGCIETG